MTTQMISILGSLLRHVSPRANYVFAARLQTKSTSRHRSHITTEGSTSHLLARLIACDDEVHEINALLVVTSERLETELNRADTSERRVPEYFSQLCQTTQGRGHAEQDAACLREELKLYQL